MTDFTCAGFILGILETFIGAALGFMLGLFAFNYQQKREKNAADEENRNTAIEALSRVNLASGENIVALANFKLHFINQLAPEVKTMKINLETYYDAKEAEKPRRFQEMKSASESLRVFYMSAIPVQIMSAPDFREFSILAQEIPALTTYVHRAMSTIHEINENIRIRNSLIAGHAHECTQGTTPERFEYYVTMISGHNEYLCQSVDDNLQFFKLAMDQIGLFMKAMNKDGDYPPYEFTDMTKEAIPTEDLFPALRSQMTIFDNPT